MAMNAHDYVAELVKRGRAAQAVANGFTQEDVDLLTAAVTYKMCIRDSATATPALSFPIFRREA